MIKLENLRDGMILRLECDITNPNADRRVTRDWTQVATIEAGSRFIVREDSAWFRIEKQGERHPGLYCINLHVKPHGPEDTEWFLGQEILRNASEPALTYADRWAQLRMEYADHYRSTLEVLLSLGEISWTQIENARNVELCSYCDAIATEGSTNELDAHCADHAERAHKKAK